MFGVLNARLKFIACIILSLSLLAELDRRNLARFDKSPKCIACGRSDGQLGSAPPLLQALV
jgi:hypothetical protein